MNEIKEYKNIERVYQGFLARHFFDVARSLYFGQDQKARRDAVEALGIKEGSRVLLIGCGPGTDIPHLIAKVGKTGSIVAIEYVQAMINIAKSRAEKNGWNNIEFIQQDGSTIDYIGNFDAAMLALVLSVAPRWELMLEKTMLALKPGGSIAIVDEKIPTTGFIKIFMPLAHLFERASAAHIDRDIINEAQKHIQNVQVKEYLFKLIFILTGTKRKL